MSIGQKRLLIKFLVVLVIGILLSLPSLVFAETIEVPHIRDITLLVETEDGPLQCIVDARISMTTAELNAEGEVDTHSDTVIRAVIVANDVNQGWIVAATIQQPGTGIWDLYPGDSCTGLDIS